MAPVHSVVNWCRCTWLDVNSRYGCIQYVCVQSFLSHSPAYWCIKTHYLTLLSYTNTFIVLVTDCTWSAVDVVPLIILLFINSVIYLNFEQCRRGQTLLQPGHSLTLMAPNTPGSLWNGTGSLLTIKSWMHPMKVDVTGSAVCVVVSAVRRDMVVWIVLSLGFNTTWVGWWRHSSYTLYLTSPVMCESST